MYRYIVKEARTGELIAEGTAAELVAAGHFSRVDRVSDAYNSWRRRREEGKAQRRVWERSGDPGARGEPRGPYRRTERQPPRHSLNAAQKAARSARQSEIARAAKKAKPGYTNERLGDLGALPEHERKFARRPTPPPPRLRRKADPLDTDVYKCECENWARQAQGKAPLSYGQWRAGLGRKER